MLWNDKTNRNEPVEQPDQQSESLVLIPKTESSQTASRPILPVVTIPSNPVVRFSPAAWQKLVILKGLGHTEIGAFAVTSIADPLMIRDIKLVPQECSGATVKFTDEGIADYMEEMVAAGFQPVEFFRIWIHTHPTFGPSPSAVDEATFRDIFGQMDWAVMFVLGKDEECYAKLRFNVVPSAGNVVGSSAMTMKLDSYVEWSYLCEAVNGEALIDEYVRCVHEGWSGRGYTQTGVGYASIVPHGQAESYYTRRYDNRGSYWENRGNEMTGFIVDPKESAKASAPVSHSRDLAPIESGHEMTKRFSEMSDSEFQAYAEENWPNCLDGLLDVADDGTGFLKEAADARKEDEARLNANADSETWASVD